MTTTTTSQAGERTHKNLSMSVGRDYRFSGRYEYVIFDGDNVVAREGCYRSSTAAKRAGIAKAATL